MTPAIPSAFIGAIGVSVALWDARAVVLLAVPLGAFFVSHIAMERKLRPRSVE
jgi:hypothetical protein